VLQTGYFQANNSTPDHGKRVPMPTKKTSETARTERSVRCMFGQGQEGETDLWYGSTLVLIDSGCMFSGHSRNSNKRLKKILAHQIAT
jgi:hypothetical protein